jgi:hypothetical protein
MNIPVRYFLVLSSRRHLSFTSPTRTAQIPCKRPAPPPPAWPRPRRRPTLTAPPCPRLRSQPAGSPMQPRNPRSSLTVHRRKRKKNRASAQASAGALVDGAQWSSSGRRRPLRGRAQERQRPAPPLPATRAVGCGPLLGTREHWRPA